MGSRFLDDLQLVSAFVPVDLKTGANDGDWVSLKDYAQAMVIFFKGAGTAGQDPTLTLEQATDVAGTSAKALTFEKIFVKQGTQTSIGTFTEISQTAKSTYTEATSAEKTAIWAVHVDAESLDVTNGFDCIRGRVADTGTSVQLGAMLYLLGDASHRPPTSAIVD